MTLLIICIFILMLSATPNLTAGSIESPLHVLGRTRPRGSTQYPTYVSLTLRTKSHSKNRLFHRSKEIKGCMPRGVRIPASAPSRYVNYHTLGWVNCNTERHH
ncbi:hypothetical protein FCM35_KLT13248 [Carex littledalei]|uniref:Secreted protein n=1 Tax=Carex littledalei TaxID=544730 RepID=A0A833V3B0_9POAL|nr:hypothetical protein FCM35_KLT13248 [Carex littledalei]